MDQPEFMQEMEAVRNQLLKVAADLASPLSQLVRAEIDRAEPYIHAGVVLASAVGNDTLSHANQQALRGQRIYLAAALEMLYIAHNIHKLLLTSDGSTVDKSVMGSTILAGDYCFGQSAMLATETENPEVVALFAQALKAMSEDNLRRLFGDSECGDENREIFVAGIAASAILAHLEEPVRDSLISGISVLSSTLTAAGQSAVEPVGSGMPGDDLPFDSDLPRGIRDRWLLLRAYVTEHGGKNSDV